MKKIKILLSLLLSFVLLLSAIPIFGLSTQANTVITSQYYSVLDDGTGNNTNLSQFSQKTASGTASPDGKCYTLAHSGSWFYFNVGNVTLPKNTEALAFWIKKPSDYKWDLKVQYRDAGNKGINDTSDFNNSINSAQKYNWYFLSTDPTTNNSAASIYRNESNLWRHDDLNNIDEGYIIVPISAYSEADVTRLTNGVPVDLAIVFQGVEDDEFSIDRVGAITNLDTLINEVGIDDIANSSTSTFKTVSDNWKLGELTPKGAFNKPTVIYSNEAVNITYQTVENAANYNVNVYNSEHSLINSVSTSTTSLDLNIEKDTTCYFQVVAEDSTGHTIAASKIAKSRTSESFLVSLDDGTGNNTNLSQFSQKTASGTASPDGKCYTLAHSGSWFYFNVGNVTLPQNTEALAFWIKKPSDYKWDLKVQYRDVGNKGINDTSDFNNSINSAQKYNWYFLSTDPTTNNSAASIYRNESNLWRHDDLNNMNEGYIIIPISAYSEADVTRLTNGEPVDLTIVFQGVENDEFSIDRVGAITDLDTLINEVGIADIANSSTSTFKTVSDNWKLGELTTTDVSNIPEVVYEDGTANVTFNSVENAAGYIANVYDSNHNIIDSQELTETSYSLSLASDNTYYFQILAENSSGKVFSASEIAAYKFSQSVINCKNLISAIGDVTPKSANAVAAAKAAYDALPEEEKTFVSNTDVLFTAIEALNYLKPVLLRLEAATEKSKDLTVASKTPSFSPNGYSITEYGVVAIEQDKLTDNASITKDNEKCTVVEVGTTLEISTEFSAKVTADDYDSRICARAYTVWTEDETGDSFTLYSDNNYCTVLDGVVTGSVNDVVRSNASLLINGTTGLNYTAAITQSTNIAQIGDGNGITLDEIYEFLSLNSATLASLKAETLVGDLAVNNDANSSENYIKLLGRYYIQNRPVFTYTNSGFTFEFVGGGDISAKFDTGSSDTITSNIPYFRAFVDGEVSADIAITKSGIYTLAENLPYGKHTIVAVNRVYARSVGVEEVYLPAGSYICGEVAKKEKRIEFIGDSITAGYGNLSKTYSTEFSDSTQTFSWYLGEYYNADVQCLAIPGNGVAWWGDGVTGNTVSDNFNNVVGNVWDFENNQVDLVCINLGTNDLSGMHYKPETCTSELWVSSAVAFLKKVREKYPDAKILWSYGVMGSGLESSVKEAIEKYKSDTGETDDDICYKHLNNYNSGAGSHPTGEENYNIADEMKIAISSLMPEWAVKDQNADKEINLIDLYKMKKMLLENQALDDNFDLNCDKSQNILDIAILRKYLLKIK